MLQGYFIESLSQSQSHLMICIGRKSVTRASPEVKRSVCKGCHGIQIPGDTAQVHVRYRRGGKKTEIREHDDKIVVFLSLLFISAYRELIFM